MLFTRINKRLYRVVRHGIMCVLYPVASIEKGNVAISRNGLRVTRQFGLEEVVDLLDPSNPTEKEIEEALKPFGGKIPFNQEVVDF